ncbi:5'-3' exoribonuclease 2 [Smittium mucronatum]|uniref:5'-3' exoribonuclease n=1 Tax=Smittium mucronatum TaxID=133383 RepID=A0A1R0GW80_9FUNG|nr:5'-3' exoribonuclease 2 [Smittium mucronatum]
MGVPAFYRWLVRRYPKSQTQVIEEKPIEIDGIEIPVDASKPNPNGFEFDNLYLDMNGIVHPCCHPEGKPPPKNEEEMMVEIFKCLDRVFCLIRPRKVVYMALDGVAPRAKMNQQRSRRFRAAFDAKLEAEKKASIIKDNKGSTSFHLEFLDIFGETIIASEKPWDSNCITPGTPFMEFLAVSLRYYVAEKLNTDPAWGNIKVIISDSNVPGEGEHKLMDFIRNQRLDPNYNPNTTHVIYGLDADLIMLALATHEPHFKILRDDVFMDQASGNACRKCGENGHFARECKLSDDQVKNLKNTKKPVDQSFVFCHIDILREYLEIQLLPQNSKNGLWDSEKGPPIDLERAIDDWIFMCFFVGNDFLPHLPSLEIREGALDKLVGIWKRSMYTMGGYLTDEGSVDLSRVQVIMDQLSQLEAETFVKRKVREDNYENRNKPIEDHQNSNIQSEEHFTNISAINASNKETASKLRAELLKSLALSKIPADDESIAKGSDDINNSSLSETRSHISDSTTIDSQTNSIDAKSIAQSEDQISVPTENIVSQSPSLKYPVLQNPENNEISNSQIISSVDEEDATHIADEPDAMDLDTKNETKISDSKSNALKRKSLCEGEQTISANDGTKLEESYEESLILAGNLKPSPSPDSPPKKILKLENETIETDEDSVVTYDLDVEEDFLINKKDNVRLYEDGYKERYYLSKFEIQPNEKSKIREIVKSYVEGLCWVFHYYYKGCASWPWYYPYHYSPFASDFIDLASLDIRFELGAPIKPLEQLMSVLPAASKENLPKPFGELMVNESSPIIEFYPETFQIDLNGKKQSWQGVCLLPFIDGDLLLNSLQEVYPKLTEAEIKRNTLGYPIICVSSTNPIYEQLCQLYGKGSNYSTKIEYNDSSCIRGYFKKDDNFLPHTTYISPFNSPSRPDIEQDTSMCVRFDLTNPENDMVIEEQTYTDEKDGEAKKEDLKINKATRKYYPCRLLKGTILPKPRLTGADREFVLTGGKSGYRGNPRGNRFGNNRDFSYFNKQQGNDVYYDRGHSRNSNDNGANQHVRYNNFNNYNRGYNGSHNPSDSYQPRQNQYRGNSFNRNEPHSGRFPNQRYQNSGNSHNQDYRYNNDRGNSGSGSRGDYYHGNNTNNQNQNRPPYRARTSFIPKSEKR